MPLVHPRSSATLVDSATIRFLNKYDVPLEDLQPQDEAALNRLLQAQLPPTVDAAFSAAGQAMSEKMQDVVDAVASVDPTLAGAAKNTFGKMEHELKALQGKMIQAAKRRDDTLRRQFTRAQGQTFPQGHPQERSLAVVYFLNQYGPALVDRLLEELPIDPGHTGCSRSSGLATPDSRPVPRVAGSTQTSSAHTASSSSRSAPRRPSIRDFSHSSSSARRNRDAAIARAVSLGAGPPGVFRTSTKCRGLSTRASASSFMSTLLPSTSSDTSRKTSGSSDVPRWPARDTRRAAMAWADRKGTPCSRARVSASSVTVIQPAAARSAIRAVLNSAPLIAAVTSRMARGAVAEHRGDQRLQIVFGIDDVAERRVVDGEHDGRRLSDRLAGDRPRVLERHGIALLRHDAAALDESVRQAQVADLGRAPQQQVLNDPAQPTSSTVAADTLSSR